MNKRIIAAGLSCLLVISTSMPAFAGQWKQDNIGWWYQDDNGSYPTSTWRWLDGNNDGIAESYYFGADGYILTNTTTPDGYTVNADGAWTVNGIVQTKQVSLSDKSNDKVTSSENQTSTSSQSKGSYYDGMPVDTSDRNQVDLDFDGDGKLTGREYTMYESTIGMDKVEQHNSHKGNIS